VSGGILLTVYGREGCHLCEQAVEVIRSLDPKLEVRVREVDIEADDDLLARYLERIPVVAYGEEEWFEFEVQRDRLVELVRAASTMGHRDDGS
jgi:glutaredoxin